jgi:putative transposase
MIYYERKLPHWHPDDAWLFITWRLYGSLPAGVIAPEADQSPSAGRAFVEWDRKLDASASGPTWLKDPRIASAVTDVIMQASSERSLCELGAFVVMVNHVHVLVRPMVRVAQLTQWIKGVSAKNANDILSRTGQQFWQHESYDHWVRTSDEFAGIRYYIERNPVRAGLVESAEQWLWSSAGTNQSGQAKACPTPAAKR